MHRMSFKVDSAETGVRPAGTQPSRRGGVISKWSTLYREENSFKHHSVIVDVLVFFQFPLQICFLFGFVGFSFPVPLTQAGLLALGVLWLCDGKFG